MKKVTALLIRGEGLEKLPKWCFLLVATQDLEAVLAAQKTELFYPDDFGAVVASGEGKDPPTEVTQDIGKRFGFDPDPEAMVTVDTEEAEELARRAKVDDSYDPRYFVEPWDLNKIRILAIYGESLTD